MSKYSFLPNGSESRFEIIQYNPEKNEVKCAGPVGNFIINMEVDPTTALDCRLVNENDEDVHYEQVTKELQERVRAAEEEGRVWYGV